MRSKRDLADESSQNVSPPPAKKRMVSSTTQEAVSSFFNRGSLKQSEGVLKWDVVSGSLLRGRFHPEGLGERPRRTRIAAFDLDSTLIKSISGRIISKDAQDWTWWHLSIPGKLRELDREGHQIVVLSNQGSLNLRSDSKAPKQDGKKLSDFKSKVGTVLERLGLPVSFYAATEQDGFRKPRTGMWEKVLDDYDLRAQDVDLTRSYFVGDAGGRLKDGDRVKKDFACTDRDFAANAGIDFKTPEEYFLGDNTRDFARPFEPAAYLLPQSITDFAKVNEQDIVLLCGSPASGKSTFYWSTLEPLGYERVNQDILKSRDKCLDQAKKYLQHGSSVAVDNTNANSETRAHWIRLARENQVPIRCVVLNSSTKLAQHNDAVRALGGSLMNPEKRAILPSLAFAGFQKRYQPPRVDEGFQDIVEKDFIFQGTEEQRAVWAKYWI